MRERPQKSRKELVPKDVRELAAQLGLRGPMYYAGPLNGEPGNYRYVPIPSTETAGEVRDGAS